MKTPFLSREKAEQIAAQIPTPYHVYDEAGICANMQDVLDAFAWNEGFREYFAVKATPNPAILKLLRRFGCGLDCSSYTELLMAQKLGFSGEQIMFSSNETAAQEYVLARQLGAIINLDDLTHVDYLARVASIPDTICLRYNPGGEFNIGNFIMGTPEEAKYGMTRPQLTQAVKRLMAMGVKRFGLHAFLASNTLGEAYYPTLAGILFETVAQLHAETGANFTFVNLSGGVGIPYRPEQPKNDIRAIGEGVRAAYEKALGGSDLGPIRIFTEMGRFVLGPYGGLVTRVIHFKHTYREYLGCDACAANLMRPAIYGAYHHITVLGKEGAKPDHVYDVVGSLCENSDKFAVNRPLPQVEIGDLLFIHDTGAHGYSMGYNYNGKLRSAEVMLHPDGSFDLIRRAETPEDYFATLDIYPEFRSKLE